MGFLEFGATVIIVSTSGVLSPGPLFFANLIYGGKYGYRTGLKCSYGHTIVELPLILLLAFGVLSLDIFPSFRPSISIIGGITLMIFAAVQVLAAVRRKNQTQVQTAHSPVLVGIIFSALNPFFIIWWLTIGMKMITDALLLASFAGLAFMFLAHIWMDYAWLTSVAHLAQKGVRIIGSKYYTMILLGLGAVLFYFGASFIAEGIRIA